MCFEVSLLSHLLSPTLGAGSHALRAVGLRQHATVRNPGFSMELATAAMPLTSRLLGQQGTPEHGDPSSEPGTIQLGGQDARCAGASASQETQKILKSHISVFLGYSFHPLLGPHEVISNYLNRLGKERLQFGKALSHHLISFTGS